VKGDLPFLNLPISSIPTVDILVYVCEYASVCMGVYTYIYMYIYISVCN